MIGRLKTLARAGALVATLILSALFAPRLAAEPTFNYCVSGSHCAVSTYVSSVYVNSDGWVIVYFDGSLDPAVFTSNNITGITYTNGALFIPSESSTISRDFANRLYSSALTAQMQGRPLVLFVHAGTAGYPYISRAWVY